MVTALRGLLKKEVRLIRTEAMVTAGVILLYFVGLFVATHYYSPQDVAFFSILPLEMSIWLMPLFLMTSLGEERKKLYLWLYNPQAVWKLLTAKLLVALAVGVVLHVIMTYGSYVFFAAFLDNELAALGDWQGFTLFGLGMLLMSSYLSLWFISGWAVFHAIERFFKRLSLPITIGLLAGTIFLLVNVEVSGWFMQLGEWLGMSLTLPIGMKASLEGSSGSFEMKVASERINVLHLLYHIGIASLLFFLSCRLIDRGVEV